MNTTAIFVEILIVGIQASVWIILLVLGWTGYEWVLKLNTKILGDFSVLLIPFLFSFFYTLGVVIDRLADLFFMIMPSENLLLKSKFMRRKYEKHHNDNRMAILSKEGRAVIFIEYVRSRSRIVRSAFINLNFIYIASLFFIFRQGNVLQINQAKIVIVLSLMYLFFVLLLLISMFMLQRTYEKRSEQLKDVFSLKSIIS